MDDSGFDLQYLPRVGMSVKDIDQYFGVWAIESHRARGIADSLAAHELTGHQAASREYDVEKSPNGKRIAHVRIRGVMTKRGSSLSDAGSTVAARRAVTQAANDGKVDGILLHVESPGGAVNGVAELGDAVFAARASKPIVAHIEDIGASAAYWVASQATAVFANRPAEVGSIGVFMVVADQSRLAENAGIKVHVVRAGQFKGMATAGTPITEAHIVELQRRVDTTYEHFIEAIGRGRRQLSAETIRSLADGRVHAAPAARDLGLIDGVLTEDDAVTYLEDVIMSQSTSDKQTASMPDLRSALVGATSDVLVECMSAHMSLEEAKDHWILSQAEKITALQTDLAAAETQYNKSAEMVATLTEENEALRKRHSGITPIADAECKTPTQSAAEQVNELITAEMAKGVSRQLAASKVRKQHPALFDRLMAEANNHN
jgi:signal peptide peptidase SppA